MPENESTQRKYLNVKTRATKKGHKVVLDWLEPAKVQEWGKHGLEEAEPAMDSFYEALANLKPFVLKWLAVSLSIDPKNVAAEVKVLGVAYQYAQGGSSTVILSATVPVPGFGSPLVLNFPQAVPDNELRARLDELEIEASSYIDGDRGQPELGLPEEGADLDATQDELEV